MSNEHGRLLVRAGVILFAISLVNGFLVHVLPLEHETLAAHVVGLIGAAILIALGSLWSRLAQTFQASRTGVVLAIYGFVGGWLINFVAAVTGDLGVFPISVGVSHGSLVGNIFVSCALLTVALADFALAGIVLRGLGENDKI